MKTWEHYKKAGKARRRCERNRYKNICKEREIINIFKPLLDKIQNAIRGLK